MLKYIEYNREERDICAHLLRLLLEDQQQWRPLKDFLGVEEVSDPRIFCEVALIRDSYYARKPDVEGFVNMLCEHIAGQHEISDYTKYEDLDEDLRDQKKTHPKQIRHKMKEMGLLKMDGDRIVYGSMQAMFNAKPDLVICTNNDLIIYEAKYTMGFDIEQLKRTEQIGDVWATLLYKDLGFESTPTVQVRSLGLETPKFKPDVLWKDVHNIAIKYLREDDFSLRVFSKVIKQSNKS